MKTLIVAEDQRQARRVMEERGLAPTEVVIITMWRGTWDQLHGHRFDGAHIVWAVSPYDCDNYLRNLLQAAFA